MKLLVYEGSFESPIEVQREGLNNTVVKDEIISKYFFYNDKLSNQAKYK